MSSAPGLCIGAPIHAGNLFRINEFKTHESKTTGEVFAQGRILVFGGPAPFSRLDTEQAKEYSQLSDDFLNNGIHTIVGLYCQDAFVMNKFKEFIAGQTGKDNIIFWGDGDGSFATGHGMSKNFTNQGLGVRTIRWAAVVNNGIIEHIEVDEHSEIDKTRANKLLEYVKNET